MRKHRFMLLCPLVVVVLTIGLWFEGRGEYRRQSDEIMARSDANTSVHWQISWTDHTAFPIQVAGMLSIPVATVAAPLYPLAQGGVSRSKLLGWLLAVPVLWAYIGWRFDERGQQPRMKRPYRQIIRTVLVLFSLVVLINTVEMFHVGLVYRAVGLVWVVAMLRHSMQFYRHAK